MSPPLPAHDTKHLAQLQYPFRDATFSLTQRCDGITNGTALWLGAQCLSLYLADIYARRKYGNLGRRPRAIELGSGIGLSALALSSLGWDVLATDLPNVISTVLSSNISNNLSSLPHGSGVIQVRALDWTVLPERWSWEDSSMISVSGEAAPLTIPSDPISGLLSPPFDLIITSDTVYEPSLGEPLLRTLSALSKLSTSPRPPPIYLCIERRDPMLMDRILTQAQNEWNFAVERVPQRKISKAMEKGGLVWNEEDWGGVEMWKLVLRTKK